MSDLQTFRRGPWQAWTDPSEWEGILRRLDLLIDRHGASAPKCLGELLDYHTYLLVREDRFVEAEQIVGAYLDGPGRRAEAPLRIRLLDRHSYALERMGRMRTSSQGYFAAAALADEVNATWGVRALMNAAISANLLKDRDAEVRYLDEAERLIADSLRGTSNHDRELGQVHLNRAMLLEDMILAKTDASERQALARRLRATTERGLELTPDQTRTDAGYRAVLVGANALALALLGEHDLARRRARQMFDLAERSEGMHTLAVLKTWEYQSHLAEARGDLGEARRAALEARREAVRMKSGINERAAIRRLGHLAEAGGDWEEAVRVYTEAVEYEEIYRERLGLQDWTAQAFVNVEDAYRGLVRSYLALGDPEAAFLTLDRTRARYLRDLRRHLDVRARLTPELRIQADSIQSALEETRLSLLRDDLRAADRATATYRISTLQERLQALTGNSVETAPDLDLGALQNELSDRGRTLVSYFVDPAGSVAFVVRPDTFVTVRLDATPASLDALLREVGSPWRGGTATDPSFRLGALHRLYVEVIAPLMEWLPPTAPLVIVPDRPLGGVPFGMLTTAPADDYATAPYLIRRFPISTELAASMVGESARASDPSAPPLDLLAYGRTDFHSTSFTWNADGPLSDLPHVDEEVRRIGAGIRARDTALDDEATEGRLKRQIGEARIVHLASHAESDPLVPLYSKIALWEGDGGDGVVYLYELQSQSLVADLVVLSGCSTARGRHQDGEGMVGLQYAVRSAGAQASLATLWPVDDRATVELMGAFYDALKDGLPKDEAIRSAQLAYLDAHEGLRASPFFWASPILSGDTAPVPLDVTPGLRGWAVLALAAVGLGVAWRLRRRRLDV